MRSVQRTHHRQTGIARSRRHRLLSGLSIDGVPVNSLLCFGYHHRQARLVCRSRLRPRPGQSCSCCTDDWHHVDMQIVRLAWTVTYGWFDRGSISGMFTAPWVRRPRGRHPTPLVGAHEHTVESARERHEETTGGKHRLPSTVLCSMLWGLADLIPVLGSPRTTQRGQLP